MRIHTDTAVEHSSHRRTDAAGSQASPTAMRPGNTDDGRCDRLVRGSPPHRKPNWWTPLGATQIPGSAPTRHSAVLAYLGVEGGLPELAHHSLFFSADWDADFHAVFPPSDRPDRSAFSQSFYVCRASATDPSVAPEGYENLLLLIPVPAMHNGILGSLNHTEDQETTAIVDQAVALIAQRTGIADLAQRVVVQHTMATGDFQDMFNAWQGNALGLAHTLEQSAFFRGSNAAKYLGGLYFAGATTVPGVGLPMCLISAENIVKRLRNDTTTSPMPTCCNPARHLRHITAKDAIIGSIRVPHTHGRLCGHHPARICVAGPGIAGYR